MHFLIYSVLINLTWGSGVYDFSQFEEAEVNMNYKMKSTLLRDIR